LLAPASALLCAASAGEPLLAHWTQTFMGSGARFIAQFFPLFLVGAVFGKLMDDSGSVTALADFMTKQLGPHRAILTVVLAGALVTMAASACSSRLSYWFRWRSHCSARRRFRTG
jgi:H+/gluconate symporter-like permease